MISPVTNFQIDTITPYNDVTYVLFKFNKVLPVSGYRLYRSTDGINFTNVSTLSDQGMVRSASTSTIDTGAFTYFPYIFESSNTNGRLFYFKITAVDTERNESSDSPTIDMITVCDAPTNPSVSFDGYKNSVSWTLPNITTKNPEIIGFQVKQNDYIEITDFTIYDYILSSTSFTKGSYVLVIDSAIRSIYGGFVEVEGQFDTSTTKITKLSDTNTDFPNNYNLKAYVALSTGPSVTVPIELAWTSTGYYLDTAFALGKQYIYSIASLNSDGGESSSIYFPVFTYNLTTIYPLVRTPDNSSNVVLADTVWKKIKKALMGDTFYNKGTWAVPYFKDEPYAIKGYCGLSNCNVDLFINGIYTSTTSTGIYGDFEILYQFEQKKTEITIQCRDLPNIRFSQISDTLTIHPINMYTWFYAIGAQFNELQTWISYIKNGILITNTSYLQFSENYQPLIELQKFGDEDSDAFTRFAYDIFNIFEYVGFDQSLNLLMDAFLNYNGSIQTYEIYNNYDLFDTLKTGYSFVSSVRDLERNIYNYKITACMLTSTGYEETAGTITSIDTRNWPVGTTKYVVLEWAPVENVEYYNIYKSQVYTPTSTGLIDSSTGYQFVTQTFKNVWADVGQAITSTGIIPPDYNFSTLSEVSSISDYYKLDMSAFDDTALKRTNFINIIIYLKRDSTISSYNISRLKFYLNKVLPPEKDYVLYICNNSTSNIYLP